MIYFGYTTCESEKQAQDLAQELLKKGLIACANVFPKMISHYEWEGKLETSSEVAVILKTTEEKVPQIKSEIKSLHSYDVPCLVFWPISEGHPDFMSWVEGQTS